MAEIRRIIFGTATNKAGVTHVQPGRFRYAQTSNHENNTQDDGHFSSLDMGMLSAIAGGQVSVV